MTSQQSSLSPLDPTHFRLDWVIGKGGFGKVWRAANKKTGQIVALKKMNKRRIMGKHSVMSVMNEMKIL